MFTLSDHKDVHNFTQPCLPFKIQIANSSEKGCAQYREISKDVTEAFHYKTKENAKENPNNAIDFINIK